MQIFEEGWMAGRNGDDPRTCPYPPMTVEAKEWLSFHRLGVFYETADAPLAQPIKSFALRRG